jgi:hypothetical protein
MKRLFFLMVLIPLLLNADGLQAHKRLSYERTMPLLESIKKDAIVLGEGKTEVFVFVDPLCPYSRKFMTMVTRNEKMLKKYRYYVFLYSIPRLHSEAMVSTIYASKKPGELLVRVMVDKAHVDAGMVEASRQKVEDIAAVAREIDVYKRPYLIVAKQK